MLCPKCGKEVGSRVKICDACENKTTGNPASKTVSSSKVSSNYDNAEKVNQVNTTFKDIPAGFWLRFVAVLGDSIILGILNIIFIELILAKIFSFRFEEIILSTINIVSNKVDLSYNQVFLTIVATTLIAFLITFIAYGFLFQLFSLFYNSLFESSKWQATPGKKLIGIYVTNEKLRRQTFFQALMRNLCKILSFIPFGFGYVLAGLTTEKQALHDIITKSYVIKSNSFDKVKRLYAIIVIIIIFIVWTLSQSKINFNKQSKTDLKKISFNGKNKTYFSSKSSIPLYTNVNATGYIGNQAFNPNSAYISEQGILTIREGKDFFAERKITLFFFKKLRELKNSTINAGTEKFGNPHIHISWKVPGKNLPETEILTDNYFLQVKFANISSGKITGIMNLKTGGKKEASLSGKFEAKIR